MTTKKNNTPNTQPETQSTALKMFDLTAPQEKLAELVQTQSLLSDVNLQTCDDAKIYQLGYQAAYEGALAVCMSLIRIRDAGLILAELDRRYLKEHKKLDREAVYQEFRAKTGTNLSTESFDKWKFIANNWERAFSLLGEAIFTMSYTSVESYIRQIDAPPAIAGKKGGGKGKTKEEKDKEKAQAEQNEIVKVPDLPHGPAQAPAELLQAWTAECTLAGLKGKQLQNALKTKAAAWAEEEKEKATAAWVKEHTPAADGPQPDRKQIEKWAEAMKGKGKDGVTDAQLELAKWKEWQDKQKKSKEPPQPEQTLNTDELMAKAEEVLEKALAVLPKLTERTKALNALKTLRLVLSKLETALLS